MSGLEPVLSKYFHQKAIRFGLPVSGSFELTRKCNFNCKMCYVHTTDTSGDIELTADEWIKIAEDAKKQGMLFLLLTGGEPLLRPDFPELYESLAKMGFLISINTNGSLITDKITDLFKKYPPCRVNVSLYGGSEETYEDLCGRRAFATVTDNIKKLRDMGLSVRINSVLNAHNKNDIEKIYDTAKKLGVTVRPASYMYPSVRVDGVTGCNKARLSPWDAAAANIRCKKLTYTDEQLRTQAEGYMKIDVTECDDEDPEGEAVRCRAGRCSFWLTYDGCMMPCGMMVTPHINLGDRSFSEAWEYIKKETTEIRLPVECVTCKNRKVCNVCAAMCYAETGSYGKKPSYICEMVDALMTQYKTEFAEEDVRNESQ